MVKIEVPRLRDDDKFRELILYFSEKCAADPAFGATKLNKLLFYVDFLHFQRYGKAITGHDYQKLEHGPAPRALKPILNSMEGTDVAVEDRVYHGKVQKRTIPLRKANTDVFSTDELSFIDSVVKACWGMSAKQVSDKSHQFIGWIAARINETIPYAIALISFRSLTPEELAHGRSLEDRARELRACH